MTAIQQCFRWINSLRVAAAVALGALCFYGTPAQAEGQPPTAVAQTAPAWKLQDLNGNEISSDQFKGKVVVLDFWATWCVPCIGEIPGYIEMQKKYGAEGLVIVGVSVDQKGPEHVKKFAESKGINYNLVMVDDSVIEAFGGIEAIPTTFLISRDGRIIHRKMGAMAHDDYEKLVLQALR